MHSHKAAFYNIDEITVDKIKEWIDLCEPDGGYYQYIYSDLDSWDMFLYYTKYRKCELQLFIDGCEIGLSTIDATI